MSYSVSEMTEEELRQFISREVEEKLLSIVGELDPNFREQLRAHLSAKANDSGEAPPKGFGELVGRLDLF
jgi:hypothetical protein